jgi:hypothetical protein
MGLDWRPQIQFSDVVRTNISQLITILHSHTIFSYLSLLRQAPRLQARSTLFVRKYIPSGVGPYIPMRPPYVPFLPNNVIKGSNLLESYTIWCGNW